MWVHTVPLFYSRGEKRVFKKVMFCPKLKNIFWVSRKISGVWWGDLVKKTSMLLLLLLLLLLQFQNFDTGVFRTLTNIYTKVFVKKGHPLLRINWILHQIYLTRPSIHLLVKTQGIVQTCNAHSAGFLTL